MRYIKLSGYYDHFGGPHPVVYDWKEFHAVDDDTTSKELDLMAWELAKDYAEGYGYGHTSYDDKTKYYDSIRYDWKEITEEEYREGLAN